MTKPRMRSTALGALIASVLMLTAGVADAAARTHPKIVTPKRGQVFAVGSRPTFKVTDTSSNAKRYRVFMQISNAKSFSKKTGDLKETKIGTFTRMTRKGSTFTYTTEDYNYPGWFMQVPGKYYWQAFHIDCQVKGCHVHSQLGSFIVR